MMPFKIIPADCPHMEIQARENRDGLIVLRYCSDCGAILYWRYAPCTTPIDGKPLAPALVELVRP